MTRTAQTIITGALKLLGVVGQAETPDAEDSADGLITLNEMIDGWAVDRLSIYVVSREEFTLTVGQQVYTLGSGGDFNRAWPPFFDDMASVIDNSGTDPVEHPIRVLTKEEWQRIGIKATTSNWPTGVYIDGAFPLRNVNVYPVPSLAGTELALYLPVPLSQFADLTTSYNLPPAYARAIRYNLAVEMAPEYGSANLTQLVLARAAEYLGDIRRMNITPVIIPVEPAAFNSRRGSFNIRTGE